MSHTHSKGYDRRLMVALHKRHHAPRIVAAKPAGSLQNWKTEKLRALRRPHCSVHQRKGVSLTGTGGQ